MACFFCSGACGFGHETLSCLHGPWALSIYNTVLVGCLTSYGIYAIKAISCNQAYLYCFSLLHTTFGLAIPGLLKPKPEIQACCYRRAFIDYTSFNSLVSQYYPLALLYSGVSSQIPGTLSTVKGSGATGLSFVARSPELWGQDPWLPPIAENQS